MKQIQLIVKTIALICLCSIAVMSQETPKEKVLEQLSHGQYMKAYKNLNPKQKEKIVQKYEKIERIYALAKKAGMQNSDAYKEYMQAVAKEQAMRLFLIKHRESIVIDTKEIQDYYDTHKRDYTSVHAYTLVRKNKKELDAYLKVLASSPKAELKQSFMTLAKKHSQHPTKSKGGDMGFVGYDSIVQPFGREAFSLKEKEYTKSLVKTVLGWHIIYVDTIRVSPLEKVKQGIEDTLRMQTYKKWFKKL